VSGGDFGYLVWGDGCCEDAFEDFFWRYSAVKPKTLLTALACALLVFSMMGCGTTNKLQSVQLSGSNVSENSTGTISIGINGSQTGPVQMYVWGNYSNGKSQLLNGEAVVYQMAVTTDNPDAVDPVSGALYPLPAPPQTLELSATGLLTAVSPSACSWFNSAVPPATAPAWSMVGSYSVTATYKGMSTPPLFVAIASAPGVYNATTNPTGACGPTT
jgi:hypothetical protein